MLESTHDLAWTCRTGDGAEGTDSRMDSQETKSSKRQAGIFVQIFWERTTSPQSYLWYSHVVAQTQVRAEAKYDGT